MSSEPSDRPMADEAPRGAWFWACVVVGWAGLAYGVHGLVDEGEPVLGFTRWFVGAAILHDLLLAPAAYTIAWAIGRIVPRRAVVPVRLGLAASALAVAYAWPLVRGYGRRASNPSALPLDYVRNLTLVLVAIWVVVAVWVAASVRRDHRAGSLTKDVPLPHGP